MGSQVLVVKVVRGPWCENERRVGMPVGVVKNSEKTVVRGPKVVGGPWCENGRKGGNACGSGKKLNIRQKPSPSNAPIEYSPKTQSLVKSEIAT